VTPVRQLNEGERKFIAARLAKKSKDDEFVRLVEYIERLLRAEEKERPGLTVPTAIAKCFKVLDIGNERGAVAFLGVFGEFAPDSLIHDLAKLLAYEVMAENSQIIVSKSNFYVGVQLYAQAIMGGFLNGAKAAGYKLRFRKNRLVGLDRA
jgi:hypothetical protein